MPNVPEALNLARRALEAGDRVRARYIYEQILQAAPTEPNALCALGMLSCEASQWDAAEGHFRRAIDAFPDEPAFHNHLHLVYRRQGRRTEAIACCRRALELAPAAAELHNNLGIALKEARELDAAVASLERSIQLDPQYADAHYNLANALTMLGRLDEAERAYRRAIELAPRQCDAHNNLGTLLETQGRLNEAMACYEAALHADGDSAEAHRNRALLRLLCGDYAQGWPEYEWRWRTSGHARPSYSQPQWEGQRVEGRAILLIAEQGLGDTVQLVRYAPLVQEKSGARVVLTCPRPWHALLQTAPGIDRLVATDDVPGAFDYYVPLLSLPMIFKTTLETIPARIPYLAAESQRVEYWQRELAAVGAFKVGIAWQGNPEFAGDRYRSIPLEHFAPLADCEKVRLFSLQKNFGREQLAALPAGFPIVDLDAKLDESTGAFVDTAAVMMSLDLVITSDTATAHVAGALGVPVWVALQYKPNWRFLLDRRDSPWYPTMRLFRQAKWGAWPEVFRQIAGELRVLSR